MMVWWYLWQALQRPPADHPQFQRILKTEKGIPPIYVLLTEAASLFLFVPFILLTSTVYGIGWVVTISQILSQQRQNGMHDLLSVSPGGQWIADWATASGCLYRNRAFTNLTNRDFYLGRLAVGGLLAISFLKQDTPPPLEDVLLVMVYIGTAIAALHLDHIQTIVLSVLISMTGPRLTRSHADSQLIAFFAFLLAQTLSYLTPFLVAFVLLPAIYAGFNMTGFLASLSLPLIALTILFGLRATLIARLWRSVGESELELRASG